ncbi:Fur family transcriptional regulator [Corynebacterium sp.]|uniref:Fur family transcriptional regulator n=1 Tax=Corynebacterium sp. TaxID=1720 RepID=UPI0026DCB138|nr:Fur family transcriptional regulator [Corynebacterium sp.]MDO5031035.1 Fur family transcriptional regulator [Corynebacterium sp.]
MSIHDSIPKLGVRNTKQRTAVVEVLRELDKFSSAKDIHKALQDRELKVGLTTVYRTLQSLSEIDAVDALHMPSGETLYRHCESEHHHHHLVCTKCGRTEEIDGGAVEKWATQVATDFDFEITGHDAEIFGICAECRSAQG